jgi:hypothetical protein
MLGLVGLAAQCAPLDTSSASGAVTGQLRWDARPGASLALVHGERTLWRFHYGAGENQPFFPPLGLPDGRVLTRDQPSDHVWHHGLWFCWKFINGVNYWEHARGTGKPAGRTTWTDVEVEPKDDFSARIGLDISYRPAGGDVVLTERRTIAVSPPDTAGTYRIDWSSVFTARADRVVLDRTPLPGQRDGKAWGGYAGLSLRLVNMGERRLTSVGGPAKFNKQNRHRSKTPAMDYSGVVDGAERTRIRIYEAGGPRVRERVVDLSELRQREYVPLRYKPLDPRWTTVTVGTPKFQASGTKGLWRPDANAPKVTLATLPPPLRHTEPGAWARYDVRRSGRQPHRYLVTRIVSKLVSEAARRRLEIQETRSVATRELKMSALRDARAPLDEVLLVLGGFEKGEEDVARTAATARKGLFVLAGREFAAHRVTATWQGRLRVRGRRYPLRIKVDCYVSEAVPLAGLLEARYEVRVTWSRRQTTRRVLLFALRSYGTA